MSKEITRIVKDHTSAKRLEIQATLQKLLASGQKGIKAVAATLSNPVKTTMDIKGVARKLWALEKNIEKGIPLFYETDIERTPAIVTSKFGGVYGIDLSPKKVYLNEGVLQTRMYIDRSDLYTKTYDVYQRARQRLEEGGQIREDLVLFGLASAAANSGLGNPIPVTAGRLDLATLAKSYEYIENRNLPVNVTVVNPGGSKGIRSINRLNIDEKGQQEVRETGELGNLWGAGFVKTVLVEPGRALTFCTPEYLGRYFIRADSLVDEINEPQRARVGFVFYHLYAAAIHNVHGVVETQFNPLA